MLKAAVLSIAVAGLCGMAAATLLDHRVAFNVFGIFGLLAMLRVSPSDSFQLPAVLRIAAAALYATALIALIANEFSALSVALITAARCAFIASLALLAIGRIRAHLVGAGGEDS